MTTTVTLTYGATPPSLNALGTRSTRTATASSASIGIGAGVVDHSRWRRLGNPLADRPVFRGTMADRFLVKVNKDGPLSAYTPHLGPCWLWTSTVTYQGYGRFGIGQRNVRAHRFSYELFVGPIPAGLELDHLCRVKGCVNPAHLEPVTHRENNLRGECMSAINARKTHCKRGHPFSGDNLRVTPKGHRICRARERDYQDRRRKRVATG